MSRVDTSSNDTVPAFLTLDDRIPAVVRDLIAEADGCLKNAFLTGGTACAQRAINLVLTAEKIEGADIEARLRGLAEKYPAVPQMLTTVLQRFGDATSRDGAKLSASGLQLLVVTLKAIMYEIYVLGPERVERLEYVRKVFESIERKTDRKPGGQPEPVPVPAMAASRAS